MEWIFDSDIVPGQPLPCDSNVKIVVTVRVIDDYRVSQAGKTIRFPRRWFKVEDGRFARASIRLAMDMALDKLEDKQYSAEARVF